MLNINKLIVLFAMLFFQQHLFAESIFSAALEKRIKFFNKSCNDKDLKKIYKNKDRPNRLMLIDATDPLNEGQIQYLRDNYINGIEWQNKGEYFTMVLLDDKDISKLTYVSLCSPLNEDQISWTSAKTVELKKIKEYKKTINAAFDVLVNQKTAAKSTRLIETLYQIYTNKRFNFTSGKRDLLIASDLMQISKEVDLRCKNNCPTFDETKKKKKAWFDVAKLGLTEDDTVELYYFQTKCLVNLETLRWWEDYFVAEGISSNNLYGKAENGVSDISCGVNKKRKAVKAKSKPVKAEIKPVKAEIKPVKLENKSVKGESKTPGPVILQVPRNGKTGFTSVR